jgi:PAS domain S-box-containing protein
LWAVSTNPVFNEDGSSAGHRSSLRDITERKRVEEALRRSEANYRQLFDTSPTAIYQIDFRTGKFLKANDIICEYFGCTQKEITSLSPYDLLTDQSKQLLLERLRQMGLGEKVTENPEYEFIDKSGKRRWLQLNSKNIYDSEGSVIGADVVAHEITERKQSEEELLESEEKYRNVFENANEAIFVAQEGNLIYFNPITSIISGYPGEELTSRPFVDFIYPDDRDMVIDRHIRRIKGEDVPQRYSYRIIHKDGSIRWAEASAILINWKGKPAVLNFVNDITERKRAEDEKRSLEERLQRAEKMEALGTLAGGVAHDLNNVLGVILGFAELLLNEVDESSPLRSNLTIIMNGSEKASLIVQDLLTLARRSVPSRKVLNLNKIILDYQTSPELENLSSYHPAMHIKLDLEPDLLNISGSSVHLEKALFNLASNAVEAMPKGGNLTIKTANQYLDKPIYGYDTVREGDYVVLSVTDTGEGIPSADLQRIFEPFYTKKVMGRSGTGLGLAVVWGTVKDHQGYINVQSEEGKGSTFTLYFPVTREEISVAAASVSISEYLGKGETILVVDDVQEQRQLAAAMLKKLNYKVSSVASGESAIEYLKNHKVDLLVLDMIMDPGMDGLDTYKSVLKIQPQQKTIIVSGFSETQRVNEAQALGAGAYVKKPYITEKLGLAVRKELDKSA